MAALKNSLLTLVFILSASGFSMAQYQMSYEIRETVDFYKMNKFVDGKWKTNLSNADVKGSPYLNDEFISGTLYTTQKKQYNNIPLRYNIFNDDLEFKTSANEIQALATPEIVEIAEFGQYKLVYSAYLSGSKTKNGFLVVLENGKAALLAKSSVIYQEPTEPGAYKEAEPAKFVKRADEYYIRIGNAHAQPIAAKKDLVQAFPDNQDKIESYITKNKIKTNKAEGLKELVKYYNSL